MSMYEGAENKLTREQGDEQITIEPCLANPAIGFIKNEYSSDGETYSEMVLTDSEDDEMVLSGRGTSGECRKRKPNSDYFSPEDNGYEFGKGRVKETGISSEMTAGSLKNTIQLLEIENKFLKRENVLLREHNKNSKDLKRMIKRLEYLITSSRRSIGNHSKVVKAEATCAAIDPAIFSSRHMDDMNSSTSDSVESTNHMVITAEPTCTVGAAANFSSTAIHGRNSITGDSVDYANHMVKLGGNIEIPKAVLRTFKRRKLGSYIASIMGATLTREHMAMHSMRGQRKYGVTKPRLDPAYVQSLIDHVMTVDFEETPAPPYRKDVLKAIRFKLHNEEAAYRRALREVEPTLEEHFMENNTTGIKQLINKLERMLMKNNGEHSFEVFDEDLPTCSSTNVIAQSIKDSVNCTDQEAFTVNSGGSSSHTNHIYGAGNTDAFKVNSGEPSSHSNQILGASNTDAFTIQSDESFSHYNQICGNDNSNAFTIKSDESHNQICENDNINVVLGPNLVIARKILERLQRRKYSQYVGNIMAATLTREQMANHSMKGQKRSGKTKPGLDSVYVNSMIGHVMSVDFDDQIRPDKRMVWNAMRFKLKNEDRALRRMM